MRIFIALIIPFFLVACNGNDTTVRQVPYSDPGLVAKVDGLTKALAAATHVQAQQAASIGKIQLIGRPVTASQTSWISNPVTMRMMGEITYAAALPAGSFGPCPDMGVEEGYSMANGINDPLAAISKAFKTCMGYHVQYMTNDGSVKPGIRLFWDGAGCHGNRYEWEAGGAGYNTATLQDGVVFVDPSDGVTELMVSKGQIPQPIHIMSVWVENSPGCQPDDETQLMYAVTLHDGQTGASTIPVGAFTTGSP